jgi:hypothetical protein
METRKEKEEKALHDVFKSAADRIKEPGFYNKGTRSPSQFWPRTSDSAEPGDEHSHIVKPQGKEWTYVPVTEEDKAIYDGLHIHTQSNPTGMHTHLKGGKSGGAHTHSPQNPLGGHTHKDIDVKDRTNPQGFSIDGHHYHDYNENKPGGQHTHHPENFA